MKKILAILLALIMVISLCACGAKKEETKQPATQSNNEKTETTQDKTSTDNKNAVEVKTETDNDIIAKIIEANKDLNNYHLDYTVSMIMSATNTESETKELETFMESNIICNVDIYEEKAHGYLKTDGSFLGMGMSDENEIYVKDGCIYKLQSDGSWTYEYYDEFDSDFMNASDDFVDKNMLEKGTLSFNDTTNKYTISVKLADLSEEAAENFDDIEDSDSEAFNNSYIRLTFDDEYRLLVVEMDKLEVTSPIDEEDEEAGIMKVSMDIEFILSKYNEIDENSVTASDDIVENAVQDLGYSYQENDPDEIRFYEMPDTNIPDKFVATYNGVALKPGEFTYHVFEDHFELADYNDEYTATLNIKDSDDYDITVYVYTAYYGHNKHIEDPIYGYDITIWECDNIPFDFEIGGITFGATLDDVKAALGDPYYDNKDEEGNWYLYYDVNEYYALTIYGMADEGAYSFTLDV